VSSGAVGAGRSAIQLSKNLNKIVQRLYIITYLAIIRFFVRKYWQPKNVIPIVNENDVISVNELMFTDNDELAGLIASMMNADALMILSTVDGILDGHPDKPTSKTIAEIDPDDKAIQEFIMPSKSSFGRG